MIPISNKLYYHNDFMYTGGKDVWYLICKEVNPSAVNDVLDQYHQLMNTWIHLKITIIEDLRVHIHETKGSV